MTHQFDGQFGERSDNIIRSMAESLIVVGPDGNLYVTVGSICPTFPGCNGATGGVIKITLPHND